MQQEKWIKWKPIERIPNTLYIEELKETRDGLTIVMTREDNILPSLIINFDTIISYRNTDESYLLKTLNERENFNKWPLFKIKNSQYLVWFHEQTYDIYKKQLPEIIHYAFITPNDVIDVLAIITPILKWE